MLESKDKTCQPWRDWLVQFGMALLAVALALLVGAVIILLMGASPVAAYRAILYGVFGNINNLSETVVKAAPRCWPAPGWPSPIAPTCGTSARRDRSTWAAWPRSASDSTWDTCRP